MIGHLIVFFNRPASPGQPITDFWKVVKLGSPSKNHSAVTSFRCLGRKHEGWGTARLPKPRQGKSRGRGRVRTTDLPVSKFVL
ncbi:hypothetical protein T265_08162 [Opisthorchis viverrini]|uniref:Uncharacterized protein n=1 Tax=Opisthorchis viverrini TaxID=6198 RepID=A0A074ZAI9_OPIVI|nr:hypothetical protein T265_08162 [Opisthorchis viverrini]KER24123.1 hypothetical protein T265_08162 [Opisthorchis viverrini]